jgi:hypothetical protein
MIALTIDSHFKNLMLKMPDFAPFFMVFLLKLRFYLSHISKRLCSISTLPAGAFHGFEHKNPKKMIRISFHYKSPRSSCPRTLGGGDKSPRFKGTKFPDLPAPVLWREGTKIPGLRGQKSPIFLPPYSGGRGQKSPIYGDKNPRFAVLCSLFSVLCSPFSVPCFLFLKGVNMKIKNFPEHTGTKPPHPVSASRGFYDDQFDNVELDCILQAGDPGMREEIKMLRVLVRRMVKLLNRRPDDPHIIKDYVAVSKMCAQISNLRRTENAVDDNPDERDAMFAMLAESTTNFLKSRKEKL